jgi:hypothetical protein
MDFERRAISAEKAHPVSNKGSKIRCYEILNCIPLISAARTDESVKGTEKIRLLLRKNALVFF